MDGEYSKLQNHSTSMHVRIRDLTVKVKETIFATGALSGGIENQYIVT